ncbi:hypothetical protein QLH51_16380 [Sphingomonas sp. 2R-10]|uniref:TlpA family protein disulfide reductase n=1 Tax=Sphingomonas sp. 2R-10 TaxID=3045148 RepID=UPI000F78B84D|nr:hypothetical protein [Sphingomonas sp. 2R-10]MDJ0278375.1 hypothetical protein [Sphingomonas sp. 2R-10]
MQRRERWSGWAAIALLVWIAGPAMAAPRPLPPRAILLFVASWCAPCHGEIAQLPRLSEAARPYKVTVVPIDRGRATAAMLANVPAAQRWVPDAAQMAAIRAELLGGTAGLPFSVAIGVDGRVCGEHRGVLSPGKVEAMRRGCG